MLLKLQSLFNNRVLLRFHSDRVLFRVLIGKVLFIVFSDIVLFMVFSIRVLFRAFALVLSKVISSLFPVYILKLINNYI